MALQPVWSDQFPSVRLPPDLTVEGGDLDLRWPRLQHKDQSVVSGAALIITTPANDTPEYDVPCTILHDAEAEWRATVLRVRTVPVEATGISVGYEVDLAEILEFVDSRGVTPMK